MAKFAYVTNFDSNDISAYSIDSTGTLRPIPGSPFTARVKPASVVITRLLPFAPLSTMARQKSESAGPQTPVDEAWPVIEPTIKDLAYADKSPDEKLDLYLPAKGSGPAPLVIWIHGGGFIEGDKSSMPRRDFGSSPPPRGTNGISQIQVPNVAALVAKGYAAVSLNYRLGPSFVDGALPATRDGKAAVRFLRANASKYGLDPVGSPFGAIPLEDIWLQYSALPGISPLYSTTPRSVTPGFPAQFKRAWYGSAR
jgi:acetyl esterase/lipase